MKKLSILVLGAGATQISMVAIERASEDRAIEVAKHLAKKTGCVVTVRDANGDVLDTVLAAPKN